MNRGETDMIFVLTGAVHSGKTTSLKLIIDKLRKENFWIDGYLNEVVLENQEINGYDLFDLGEKRSIPFIRREGEEDWERVGSYSLIPQGLSRAKGIILRGTKADILVVDEVGPLELAGKGVWPALEKFIFLPKPDFILVVRKNILQDFLELIDGQEVRIFDTDDTEFSGRMIQEVKRIATGGPF